MYPSLLGKFSYDVSLRAGDRNLMAGFEKGPLFAGLLIGLYKLMVFFLMYSHMVCYQGEQSE